MKKINPRKLFSFQKELLTKNINDYSCKRNETLVANTFFSCKHFLWTLTFFILLGNTNLNAQSKNYFPGFYITTEKDTIRGLIHMTSRNSQGHKFNFKLDSTSKNKTTVYPDETSAYFFEPNNFYLSINDTILNKQIFINELTKGHVTLYCFSDSYPPTYYIEKKSDESFYRLTKEDKLIERDNSIYEHEDTRYKGILRITMYDCPKVVHKIDRTGFNDPELIKLVNEYNNCIQPDSISVVPKKKPRLQFGPQLGGLFPLSMEIYTTKYKNIDLDTKPGISIGAAFNLSYGGKFSFDFAALYSKYSSGLIYEYSPDLPYYDTVDFNFSYIDIPLAVRYEFLKSKLTPFIYAGINVGFLIKEDIQVNSNFPSALEQRTINPGFLKLGIDVGVGVSYKRNLVIKTGYFWQEGLHGVNTVLKMGGVAIYAAYMF